MALQVSVIVPVYNSVNYVRDAIRSVQEQTIDPDLLELLVVDDGSTDGSGALLDEMAAADPRITVISQENSGTPGGGRNPAIGRAQGEFVFFLDSDDKLTPHALQTMVRTAHDLDSDVVLGKLGSMDARRAPASMFKRSVDDADLIEDNVFNTLGPTKLIRRSIIERLDLRFPEDQRSGEDQPFMAAVYLNARKISVLADRDYYLIRHRADGTNMTLGARRAEEHLLTAVRLSQTIEQYTEPGERRDALLRRPFTWTMKRVLDGRWLRLPRAEQELLAATFRDEIGHLYTEGLRERVPGEMRWKLDLLAEGHLEGLAASVEYLANDSARQVRWASGAFLWSVPAELEALVPARSRETAPPKMSTKLEDLRVDTPVVQVSASVKIADFEGGPELLGIRGRRRHSDEIEDFTVTGSDLSARAPTFLVNAEHGGLARGVWDLFVVVTFGEYEKELRLGADRARSVEPEGVSNLAEDPLPQDRLIAYYTQGPGNLSIDRGGLVSRNTARARSLGLTRDDDGRAILLVQTARAPHPEDEYFCYLEGVAQHGGRQLLPSTRLGDRVIGLRLPVAPEMIGATVRFAAALNGVRTPLAVVGTEYWPARAAGFDLVADESGGMVVEGLATRPKSGPAVKLFQPARPDGVKSSRPRTVDAIKSIPVVGVVLTRAVRSIRGWRA